LSETKCAAQALAKDAPFAFVDFSIISR
jgi:hypothetical protein